jgi:type I restriction enzyme R subunit
MQRLEKPISLFLNHDMSEFFNRHEEIDKHRHNLPHWQQGETWIFLTCSLADSLPEKKLAVWRDERTRWLAFHPQPWDEATENEYDERFTERIEQWLDQGHGECLLARPEYSKIVADAFRHFDGRRYRLGPWVVMPNHVHLLFQPLRDHRLPDLVHTWKRFTAREINLAAERSGALWQADYWDRLIRSEKHLRWATHYIEKNPEMLPPGTYRLG